MAWTSFFAQTTKQPQQAQRKTLSEASLQLEQLEPRQMMDASPVLLNINPIGSSNPEDFTEVHDRIFFTAQHDTYGRELWATDGTSAGTQLVKDINLLGHSNPDDLVNVNGTLFFTADSGFPHGRELWMSDGTEAGTQMVKNIFPGPDSSDPLELTNVNGTLFFVANGGLEGVELWKSDGTSAGTQMVKDINDTGSSTPNHLTNVNGTLFFAAHDGDMGVELWMSNGTSAGTQLVKDIRPGGEDSSPTELFNANGTLFFVANDGVHSFELWRSDGTSAGTTMIRDIDPSGSSFVNEFTEMNGTVFFQAYVGGITGRELWRTDGTSAGTMIVKDINFGSDISYPQGLTNVNGMLFFSANDGVNGYELWKSDGTTGGTVLVKNVLSGSADSDPSQLTNVNGTLFFTNTTAFGNELWMSDGTLPGTQLVKDLHPASSTPTDLINLNGTLFFQANDNAAGRELWMVDLVEEQPIIVTGTDAGVPATVRVFDEAGNELLNFTPYSPAFTGGVRVAVGDFNGDNVMDIVTVAGPTGGPHVQVFDGQTGNLLAGGLNNFYAYDPAITNGLFVAVGDVNGDGFDDIITSVDVGGGPHIKAFDFQTGDVITEFYAYHPEFVGGVRIACGDVNGDGHDEIITAPGVGGGPRVRVFNGMTGAPMIGPATDFYAYDAAFLGGIYVAAGDIDNDGRDDIITAPGAGGGPHIRAFSSADLSLLQDFYAYNPAFLGGVRVGSADINNDGFADILTVPGATGGPHVRAFSGVNLADLSNFYSGNPAGTSGLFIAGGAHAFPVQAESGILSLPFEKNAPFEFEALVEDNVEEEAVTYDSLTKKKSWLEEADEFYSHTEEIDDLFRGLGIK
ncbi:Hypothetical protein PBC10988_32240 [Planctomycetales bacterium 10988]|nr:Hypothetical protein PBC10988_32240 [Planctomycetales bacterium 10988]